MAVKQATFQSINPATGEMFAEYEEFSPSEVDEALDQAVSACEPWRRTSFEHRAALLREAAGFLRENIGRFAGLITREMGKTIGEAEAEIKKCAWNCEFYAENAPRFLADEPVATNATESFVAFEPLGVVLAVMPWNYPFWQVIRFAAPALMAGNAAVLKHSANIPQCALALEEIFAALGFPPGIFRTLLVASRHVSDIIADDRIAAVTLTGSSEVGRSVASAAGQALKKTVLELGGSDPFIVLSDADLDGAVEFAVKSRFQNTGQSCIAAKRFIVEEAIASDFERRFARAVGELRVGDPADRSTQVGPLAREDLVDSLEKQVRDSERMGARVAVGGHPLDRSGYFYAPTVLTNVTPDMRVFNEETFGPAAAVIRVPDPESAVALANHSRYGLGGNLWTGDVERGKELARHIQSGNVFINGMVASDPRLPFGGVKDSGYGRELSHFGIREFTNVQTIWIGPPRGEQMPVVSE